MSFITTSHSRGLECASISTDQVSGTWACQPGRPPQTPSAHRDAGLRPVSHWCLCPQVRPALTHHLLPQGPCLEMTEPRIWQDRRDLGGVRESARPRPPAGVRQVLTRRTPQCPPHSASRAHLQRAGVFQGFLLLCLSFWFPWTKTNISKITQSPLGMTGCNPPTRASWPLLLHGPGRGAPEPSSH